MARVDWLDVVHRANKRPGRTIKVIMSGGDVARTTACRLRRRWPTSCANGLIIEADGNVVRVRQEVAP